MLLLAAAFAQEPDTISIRGWSATDYNDHIVDISDRMWMRFDLIDELSLVVPDEEAAAAELDLFLRACDEGIAALQQVPPYRGDASIRDSALQELHWMKAQYEGEGWVEVRDLYLKPEVLNADLERLESLTRTSIAQATALEETVLQAQEAFARKHRFSLVDRPAPSLPEGPEFSHPGLPPEGSVLKASTHAGFAIRYDGMVLDRQNAMVDALNVYIESPWEGHTGPASDLERERDLAAGLEDWQGDASYRDAAVALADDLVGLLREHGPTVDKYINRLVLFPKARRSYDSSTLAIDEDSDAALARFAIEMEAFRDRWGITAWDRFVEAHDGERRGD